VIDERDVFMAKALAAAATGTAAVAPALVADTGVDGAPLWRYVMGQDGPGGESPSFFAPLAWLIAVGIVQAPLHQPMCLRMCR
jgi:hypothetical protein